ncbi:MAG: S8 family serine peptidase, partial [Gemmatimonadota bacterium]|nr:S8 family serine peptidase [Gemmatimonadota bacterium]
YDGSGVNVYVIDTGIQISHAEFGGRAHYLPNSTNGNFVGDSRNDAADCHGHGTHVAGTAAGSSYGVAKNATVWAVRVLDCGGGGTSAGLVAAVDWIAANYAAPATANMSLSSGIFTDPPIDAAVEGAVAAGVNFQAAAGNGFLGVPLDACQTSPARTPSANTIGATDVNDTEAPFSNYGTCVDLLAPGVNVTSAWIGSNSATATISGTSMATPHATGVTALYLEAFPDATPAAVSQALKSNAVIGVVTPHVFSELYGTANRLLSMEFLGDDSSEPPVGNAPPNADFTPDVCATLTCDFLDASSDTDGDIVSWSWNFGDGSGPSSEQNPSHTYPFAGQYPVTLTVADDDGATSFLTKNVTVSEAPPPPSALDLVGAVIKVKGKWAVELTWTGAQGPVTVLRLDLNDPSFTLVTVTDDGAHPGGTATDQTEFKTKDPFAYAYEACDDTSCKSLIAGNN